MQHSPVGIAFGVYKSIQGARGQLQGWGVHALPVITDTISPARPVSQGVAPQGGLSPTPSDKRSGHRCSMSQQCMLSHEAVEACSSGLYCTGRQNCAHYDNVYTGQMTVY